jgi:hypothetical protein
MKKILEYSDIFDSKTFKVHQVWDMYAVLVLPKDVSRVQYDETKKAFYAGFLECFKIMTDYASNLEEDDACQLFTRLNDEGMDFMKLMIEQHGTSSTEPEHRF